MDQRDHPERYNLVIKHDAKTGQELFKPQLVSKSPDLLKSQQSARDQLNPKYVSEYLYRHGQIMLEKRKANAEIISKQLDLQ